MAQSLEELLTEFVNDTRPAGNDGCSNHDRINFISEVFETNTIDLNQRYDFTPVVDCKDLMLVEASKHLILLKLSYLDRVFQNYHIDRGSYDTESSLLILSLQRVKWHIKHLSRGVPTPPFPSIH